jgi:hypothetical protein
VISTREFQNFVTTRRRQCLNCGHRFNTREMHSHAVRSNMAQAVGWVAGAKKRIAFWHRDIKIAETLYLGTQHLSQLYNLTKSGVYYAAARGRKYLQLQKKDK